MNKRLIFLFSALFLITACAPQADIQHNREETKILLTEGTMETLSFHAFIENHNERPSDTLTITWEIDGRALQEALSEPELLEEGSSEAFSVSGGGNFVVNETYYLDDSLTPEEVSENAHAVIKNEEGEEVYRFTFENVEYEEWPQ